MEWLRVLNLEAALANIRIEMTGDWYRDPWGWCELPWLVSDGGRLDAFVMPRLDGTGVAAAQRIDVPKENFGIRPAVVLDGVDRLIYQALTDRLSKNFVGALPDWSYGWRLQRSTPEAGCYARNNVEWKGYRSHLKQLARGRGAALVTDVVSFFASIPRDPLVELIV